MGTPLTFGHWLRQRRKTCDLTQDGLAEQVGCSSDMIQKIEAGTARPSRQLADLLLQCLGLAESERPGFVQWARSGVLPGGLSMSAPDALPTQASPSMLPTSPRTNLPFVPTPLVGRTLEMDALRHLLWQASTRLVTLTGPPGTGKTRLAIHLAASLLDDYPDGIWFVPLASIRDPERVILAIIAILGIKEIGSQPLTEPLTSALRDKHLLLVLDNFEQVLDAGPLIARLLAAAARLKVVVTSREVLRLYGEHEFPVPPLLIPDADTPADMDCMAKYEALELFRQRAVAVQPGFALTAETGPTVVEICRRLDGLPLAIELAAARVRLLAPAMILERLSNRLRLLVRGPREYPVRQQTLRGAIAWSYDLLAEEEQRLFRRLGVFVGGFSLESATVVCNATGDRGTDTEERVEALLTKSLLRPEPGTDGQARYGMLETIREFALERLEESGEATEIRSRYATFFGQLAERADQEGRVHGQQQVVWLNRLEEEHDNIRTTLEWVLGSGEAGDWGLRLSVALTWFWSSHGHFSEGRQWQARALTNCGEASPLLEARALRAAGNLAFEQGDMMAAKALHLQSLALSQELGDKEQIAAALCSLGNVVNVLEEHTRARTLYEESLALWRELGDKRSIAMLLNNMGHVARYQGDYAAAQTFFLESLTQTRGLGNDAYSSVTLYSLGLLAIQQGDEARARAYLVEAMSLFEQLGDRKAVAMCLRGFAEVANMRSQFKRAARLLGAEDMLYESVGAFSNFEKARYEQLVAGIRAQLGETGWQVAWAEGQAMSLEQAINYALG